MSGVVTNSFADAVQQLITWLSCFLAEEGFLTVSLQSSSSSSPAAISASEESELELLGRSDNITWPY